MRYLKTFEHIKSSYENFTPQELDRIDDVLDNFDYILSDEGYNIKRMKGDPSEGTYRYRILVYLIAKEDNTKSSPSSEVYDIRRNMINSISNSDEFNEFIDRIRNELGDNYLIYVENGGLLFIVIEKVEKTR